MNIDHTSRLHARFGPSSANRWVNCPASIRLQEEYANILSSIEAAKDKSAAEEGTRAHEALEEFLRNEVIIEGTPPEMEEHIRWAAGIVNSLDGEGKEVLVEHRVRLTDDIWGTADAIIYTRGEGRKEIDIFDFKYGRNEVSAVENYQLGLYALAFLADRCPSPPLKLDISVRLHILQPRCGRETEKAVHSVWDAPAEWLRELLFNATQAASMVNTAWPKIGRYCQYCPAKGFCSAHLAEREADFSVIEEPLPEKPSPSDLERIAALVTKRKQIFDWLDDAETFLLSSLTEDETSVPGYQIKQGIKKRVYNTALKLPKIKEILLGLGLEENNFIRTEEKLLPLKTVLETVSEDELRESGVMIEQTTKPSIVVARDDFSPVEDAGN